MIMISGMQGLNLRELDAISEAVRNDLSRLLQKQASGESLADIQGRRKIDDLVFNNGYESHSGFRDAFYRIFGMPPGKAAGKECIYTYLAESPLGSIILAATSKDYAWLRFTDRRMLEYQIKTLKKYF